MQGNYLQYMFSHTSTAPPPPGVEQGFAVYAPNSFQVYLVENGQQNGGNVRAIVRDNSDLYERSPGKFSSHTYLDSSGSYTYVNATYHNSSPQAEEVQPGDGKWHMFTVSSNPGGGKGFRLYIDGLLMSYVDTTRCSASCSALSAPTWSRRWRSTCFDAQWRQAHSVLRWTNLHDWFSYA